MLRAVIVSLSSSSQARLSEPSLQAQGRVHSAAKDSNPALGGSPAEYYYKVQEMALGELSCTQYLKTKSLLAKSIGDSLSTFENLFSFFKQYLETNNLTLNNLCLSLSVAG